MSVYSQAVALRSERVDYSVTKGGVRVWVALFLFVLLVGGLVSLLTAGDMSELANALDIDGDGDHDNIDDDDADHIHEENERMRKEQEAAKVPSKQPTITSHPPDKKGTKSHTAMEGGSDAEDENAKMSEEGSMKVKKEKEKAKELKIDTDDEVPKLKPIKQKSKTKKTEVVEESEEEPEESLDDDNDDGDDSKVLEKAVSDKVDGDDDEAKVVELPESKRKQTKQQRPDHEPEEVEQKPELPRDKAGKKKQQVSAVDESKLAEDVVVAKPPRKKVQPVLSLDEPEVKYVRKKGKKPEEMAVESDDARKTILKKEKIMNNNLKQLTDEPEPIEIKKSEGHCKRDDCKQASSEQSVEGGVRYYRVRDGQKLDEVYTSHPHVERPLKFTRRKGGAHGENEDDIEIENMDDQDNADNDQDDDDDDDDGADATISKSEDKQLKPHAAVGNDDLPSVDPAHRSYRNRDITSRQDNKIRDKLDEADRLLELNHLDQAQSTFERLVQQYKDSPRAHFGLARALELAAEKKHSNPLLEQSIETYEKVLELQDVPDELLTLAVDRLVDRARFRGWMQKAVLAQQKLIGRFPDRLDLLNSYAVTLLMMGRNDDAKRVFKDVLRLDPKNGFAQVHYGFIAKTVDNNLEEGVKYLQAGINSNDKGTQDGRFFFHLGDALQRLARNTEAYKVYEKAADHGLFLSAYQRSLYNVEGITGRPWWTLEETTHAKELKAIEKEWHRIRDEGLALLNDEGLFKPEDEKLTNVGDWKQFTLFQRGRKNDKQCAYAPHTCALIENFPDAASCKRGQVKFSVMHAGTKVWPHCGPTNCRLRAHLGLQVPNGAFIRVGNETRTWRQGKFIVFDDSFEHEVWHEGSKVRLILIVDFWHPELSLQQRHDLSPI